MQRNPIRNRPIRNRKVTAEWIALVVLAVILAVASRVEFKHQGPKTGAGDFSGYPRLVDGDSFFLDGSEVRLKGIDAPEGEQWCQRDGRPWACGEAARAALKGFVGGAPIRCHSAERDQHGRYLAVCTAGSGRELNRAMVETGLAVDYGGYRREETAARLARRGLWGSTFERPRDWRRRNGIGG